MSDEHDFLPPLEIPWKLQSTTQQLTTGEPDETTISFFTYQPDDDALTTKFKDFRIVFMKVTVSISPAKFPEGISTVAASMLGEGIPCFHVLLDMKVRKGTTQSTVNRPYFHAAAPMRREMIQTGVIGAEVYEGELDSQAIGKSGSQMYESTNSHSSTSGSSASASVPFLWGVSSRGSSTDVNGSRNVMQVSDTTTRNAGQERRELISHMTHVENVLSLLNTKYIGTPYLSFSLSPRPLQQLSIDATDPSVWFGQLLHRRSSGIEGVQEFTTVIMVPKDEDFCVTARLRRVCLLDDPPAPPNFDELWEILKPAKVGRLMSYLFGTYPKGTPLDDLDLDLTHSLDSNDFPFPFIEQWAMTPLGWQAVVVSMAKSSAPPNPLKRAFVNYKPHIALWLETLRAEYERDLARSPLERGVLVGENRHLDTCFGWSDGKVRFVGSSSTVSPLTPIDLTGGTADPGSVGGNLIMERTSPKARALATITHWNSLERKITSLLNNLRKFPDHRPNQLNDARIVDVLVNRWAKLPPNDPRNLDFSKAAKALKLTEKQQGMLKAAGVDDLKSLADALKAAPILEAYNRNGETREAEFPADAEAPPVSTRIDFTISEADAQQIRKRIGDSLLSDPAPPAPAS